MSRLIDADKLIERLNHSFYPEERVSIETVTECFLDEMGCAPTIDAEPIRHGEWISVGKGFNWHYECSRCGYVDGYPFDDRHKHCPNCGAKMDGERKAK